MKKRKSTRGELKEPPLEANDDELERALAAPLPSPKQEAWRFTRPELLFDEQTHRLLRNPPSKGNGKALPTLPELGACVITDADPECGVKLPPGASLKFVPVNEVSDEGGAEPSLDKFDLLLNAVASRALILTGAKGTELSSPLLLRSPLLAAAIRGAVVQLTMEDSASGEFILWLDGGAESARYFGRCLIQLAAGAKLNAVVVQVADQSARMLQRLHFELGERAQLQLTLINLGAEVARQEIAVELAGAEANAQVRGFALAQGTQHFDLHSMQVHRAPQAVSHLRYKQVLLHETHAVFDGMVQVLAGMHGSDAYQECHTLLLSEKARVHTIPRLEIATHDVRCGHGATVKRLSPAEVFYLRSRGLRERVAKWLLTSGFLREILAGLKPQPLFEHLDGMLERSLAEQIGE